MIALPNAPRRYGRSQRRIVAAVACWFLAASVPAFAAGVANCGAQCLTVALHQLGDPVDYRDVEKALGPIPPEQHGYSLGQLTEVAHARGFRTLLVRTNFDRLAVRSRPFACIAQVDQESHFALIADVDPARRTVRLFDSKSATSRDPFTTLDYEGMDYRWDGVALLIARNELVREEDLPSPFPWAWTFAIGCVVAAIGGAVFVRKRVSFTH